MSSHTATVETLAAEVRVLMVGSRQVTMSVYNQLDIARYEDIELFGRISPKDAIYGYVYFVGRHRSNGSLVRGSVPTTVEGAQKENPVLEKSITEKMVRIELLRSSIGRHGCLEEEHSRCMVGIHDGWNSTEPSRLIAEIEAEIQLLSDRVAELEIMADQEIGERLAVAAIIADLPLIVLAGLR